MSDCDHVFDYGDSCCGVCGDAAEDIIDRLQARIAELEAAQSWVPVSERMPAEGQHIAACMGEPYELYPGWVEHFDPDECVGFDRWYPLPDDV